MNTVVINMDGCDVIFVQAPKRPRQAAAPEGKDICSRCGRVQTYGTMKAISEDSFDLLCTKCRRPRPKATFARWLNRNGASYDNDIWSQCDLDDFARRAWNAGCRAAGRRSRK